jgi:predicted N-acetyltransferase YhbS
MVTIRQERRSDIPAREALLDAAFGASRFAKAAERLREGRVAADGMALVAIEHGQLVGTIRLWHVSAGRGRPALLLGPLAVAADARKRGIGTALMRHALRQARQQGCRAVLLVGDAPFYSRFGFSAEKTAALWLPGPYERHRLLGHEIEPGALDKARGLVNATGRPEPQPELAVLWQRVVHHDRSLAPHAA